MKKFGSFILIVLSVFLLVSCVIDYSSNSVNVTFIFNNGTDTVKTQSIVKGGVILEPAVTYEGHTLQGWFECSSYDKETGKFVETGKEYQFTDSVSKDLILTAHWTGGASAQKTVAKAEDVSFSAEGKNSSAFSLSTENTPDGEDKKETTVSIPAGALTSTADSTTDVDLSITAYSISISAIESSFVVENGNTAVAGIDCTLSIGTGNVSSFNGQNVTVTTYIAKGLSSPVLKYKVPESSPVVYEIWNCNGTSDTDLSVATSGTNGKAYYESSTGKLVFLTSHFSAFYVEADVEAYIVETNTAYKTLESAVSSATAGQTIKLLKDIPLPDNDIFLRFADRVTLDLNSKTINSGVIDEDADWDYLDGYAYVFEGKNLTIQNGTFAGKNTKALPNANYYYGMYLGNDEDGNIETKNITLKNLSFPSGGINIYDAADVFISDCNIVPSGDYYSIFIDNEADYSTTASVTISSGTYGSGNLGKVFDLYGGAVISITGGTYSTDPSEYVAIGYSANKNTETNKWTVVKSTMDNCDLKISKSGETDVYTNLSQFRDSVNDGNSYAGYTITLLRNVDLYNVEWTPIGTSTNPFSGIFDGAGKTIKNLKVNVAEMGGLFGYITGNENSHYKVTSDLWNSTNYTFSEENISELYYSAVAKNITLENVNVTGNDSSKKHVAGFCAMAGYAYIENINVLSGTVTGYKVVGGVVGAAYGCTIKNCSTGSSLKVEAKTYHAGGIIGAVNTAKSDFRLAVVNCVNNASIDSNGNGSGYQGGIIGDANCASSKAQVYYNCVNNGDILASGDCVAGIVGNMGTQSAESGSPRVVALCVNNGNISTKNEHTVKNVGGIESNAAGIIYSCTNYGKISGAVSTSAAGIVGSTYQTKVEINGCYNYGDLSGITGVTPADAVSGVQNVIVLDNLTYNNVSELQNAISTATGQIVLKSLTVVDTSGMLTLPSTVNNLVSDKGYFDGLDISACSANYVTVTIPNFEYTLHGDASSKTLGLSGVNNKTTFASDCKLSWLRNYGSNGKYIKEAGCDVTTIHGASQITN